MSKKYYEVDKILDKFNSDLTEEEKSYKKIMTEKPNFNKTIPKEKNNNSKVVYRKKSFIILETKKNVYIVHNKKKKFKEGHTHTNNYNYAKSLIDLCVRQKLPRKPHKRIMESLTRLTDSKKYIRKLENFKEKYRKNGSKNRNKKNGNKNDEH